MRQRRSKQGRLGIEQSGQLIILPEGIDLTQIGNIEGARLEAQEDLEPLPALPALLPAEPRWESEAYPASWSSLPCMSQASSAAFFAFSQSQP